LVIIFANIETTLQVEKLREQGATQAQALQAAEAAAAQLVASQAEVETLREQSNSQLQAVETAEQELLAAQAEVSISGLFRVHSHENYAILLNFWNVASSVWLTLSGIPDLSG
jgi:carbamoylphosphate synthase small subunit